VRYPLFLDLTGRSVVVVGAGAVAARRIAGLLAAGAAVTVISPEVDEAVATEVAVERRCYRAGDLAGAWLALACTDDPAVNSAVVAEAEERGVWCLRADEAAASPAWRPATTRVDELTVAVSADGDPARARQVRDAVEGQLRTGDLTSRRSRPSGAGVGRVVLVGGGPGDPDLLTLRGMRALLDADVVLTDRLGPTGLLNRLSAEVEVVDVGKEPRGHAADQAEINALIIERATAGQRVVRLKGGDPFVLGRGSEEVEACIAAGLSVEVVPGITSATAAATLAGVALTERGTTQQFTVASGHVPPGDERSTVDWGALAAGDGTLVLLMAVANLAPISAALIAGGRDAATPAAIVENASLPAQRVVKCRLSEVAEFARQAGIVPPAAVIVGAVVRIP
jgi:uroporphyrin-III C-methyltransferase/precorrin-2 dehydrogenase/sirohydrochlorin ferrochelatase